MWLWGTNCLDTWRLEQNGRNFTKDIFKCFSWMKIALERLKVFAGVYLTITRWVNTRKTYVFLALTHRTQHRIRPRFGAEEVASHCLSQWWHFFTFHVLYLTNLSDIQSQFFWTYEYYNRCNLQDFSDNRCDIWMRKTIRTQFDFSCHTSRFEITGVKYTFHCT